jgi:hypothetical protein
MRTYFLFLFALSMIAATYQKQTPAKPNTNSLRMGADLIPRSFSSNLCPLKIVPGEQIGPLKLGMPRQEIEGLGLQARLPAHDPNYVSSGEGEYAHGSVGPFRITLENNKLSSVRAELKTLPNCLQYKEKKLSMRTGSLSELASKIGECEVEKEVLICDQGLRFLTTRRGLDVELIPQASSGKK